MTYMNLTRGFRRLIKEKVGNHVRRKEPINRLTLVSEICLYFGDKFHGDQLEYQLGRFGVKTTDDILNAIDNYMYRCYKKDFMRNKA